MLQAVKAAVPVEHLAVHFHDTYGQALANILVGRWGWGWSLLLHLSIRWCGAHTRSIDSTHPYNQRLRRAWRSWTRRWPGWAAAPTRQVGCGICDSELSNC